mgnify:CR=1 FL=1
MEKIILLSITLSIIIWVYITEKYLHKVYNLNNLLILLFHINVGVVFTSLINNKNTYIMCSYKNLTMYVVSYITFGFIFPLLDDIDTNPIDSLKFERKNNKVYELLIFGVLFIFAYGINMYLERFNKLGKKYMLFYLFFIMLFGFISSFVFIMNMDNILHLHHFSLAFAIALCNISNHPITIIILGASLGVMTEGLSRWGYADTIYSKQYCGELKMQNSHNLQYTDFCCRLPNPNQVNLCMIQPVKLYNIDCNITK